MSIVTHEYSVPVAEEEVIIPGDIVAVRHGLKGRQEGIVVGSHVDYAGRQIIAVQLDGEVSHLPFRTVTRVRRPVSVINSVPHRPRTVERRIYW